MRFSEVVCKKVREKKCARCKTDCLKEGVAFIQACESYYFCSYCSQALEKIGSGNVVNFINDEDLEMVENPVLKSIIGARVRRSLKDWCKQVCVDK